MAEEGVQDGLLFSRNYLDRGQPQADSSRFRARLVARLNKTPFSQGGTAKLIHEELGVKVPVTGSYPRVTYNYEKFISNTSIRDLLDSITLIYRTISATDLEGVRAEFRNSVERAMREENLSYRLDEKGGVHFYVDEEFERSRSSVVSGLAGDQYGAALEAFEDAHRALLADDTLTAVRRSFDAVEGVFKQRFGVARLGATEIKSKLSPVFNERYNGRVKDAALRLSAGFAEWTNAAHQFRHAPGDKDSAPPPMEMAILMVSEAASLLRWLISLPSK